MDGGRRRGDVTNGDTLVVSRPARGRARPRAGTRPRPAGSTLLASDLDDVARRERREEGPRRRR